MGYQKLTGSQAILGGAVLSSPTIYGLPLFYDSLTSAGTTVSQGGVQVGKMKFYVKRLTISGATMTLTTSYTDTGWDIPFGAIIDDVWVDTRIAATSAGHTLGVGIGTASTPSTLLSAWGGVEKFTPTNVAGIGTLLKSRSTTYEARVSYNTQASTERSISYTRDATTFTPTYSGNMYIQYRLPTT